MPAGFRRFNSIQFKDGILEKLEGKNIRTFLLPSKEIKYSTVKNTLILCSSLEYPRFDDIISDAKRLIKEENLENIENVIFAIVGNGISEKHIVSCYHQFKNKEGEDNKDVFVFDSKYSNMSNFQKYRLTFWARAKDFFSGIYHSFQTRPKQEIESNGYNIKSVHLGLQSVFEGVTCGMAAVEICDALTKKIQDGENISQDTTFNLPFYNPKSLAKLEFKDFMKDAWNQTFLKDDNAFRFAQDFLGWPKEANFSKGLWYFLSLRFITHPLMSVIKVLTLLPLQVLGNSCRYLRNQLLRLNPNSTPGQFLRTLGILLTGLPEVLIKIVTFVLSAVLSPIEHAKQQNGLLKGLSIFFSIIGIGAAIYFAGPLVLNALATMLPSIMPIIASIPFPSLVIGGVTVIANLVREKIDSVVNAVKKPQQDYSPPVQARAPVGSTTEENLITNLDCHYTEDGFAVLDSDDNKNTPGYQSTPLENTSKTDTRSDSDSDSGTRHPSL